MADAIGSDALTGAERQVIEVLRRYLGEWQEASPAVAVPDRGNAA